MKSIRRLLRLAIVGLVIAAVADQLRRPREERTWFGRVGGVVPYDFRVPTASKVRTALWNPRDDRMFVDTVFGVGWTVNLAAVRERLLERKAA